MAKKAKKTVKTRKTGAKRKLTTAKSAAKKKVSKTKVKRSSAAKTSRSAVKASKPKRKSIASRKASVDAAVSRSRKAVSPKPKVTSSQVDAHAGMMGDGTEEQNLNQKGNPEARITQDDIDEAFKKSD